MYVHHHTVWKRKYYAFWRHADAFVCLHNLDAQIAAKSCGEEEEDGGGEEGEESASIHVSSNSVSTLSHPVSRENAYLVLN